MKNINKIPTIQELQEKVDRDNIEFDDNYELLENIVQEWLLILKKFPDFHDFLVSRSFNNYELPTVFFAQLKYYIEECLKKNNISYVKEILNYIWKLEQKNNPLLSNIIYTWLLENFNKEELEFIWKYLPKSLQKSIIDWPCL